MATPASQRTAPPTEGMCWVPGGTFRMGSDSHYAEEAPAHDATVDGFWMDARAVTNAEFARFVDETGYVTSAEKPADPADYPGALPELLAPSSIVFDPPAERVDLSDAYRWWSYVPGAQWRHPEGPRTTIEHQPDHPVVHVNYADAEAYAAWAGKQLPSEAEWERACRGGLEGAAFAWGDELAPGGVHLANTWQGAFPHENLLIDGFAGRAPVGSFPPNGYGLYDMIGNVWEWTTDWYQPHAEAVASACCGSAKDAARDRSHDTDTPGVEIPRKATKGGSYLCARNYCQRYRPAARMAQGIDTSTCHLGIRCIARAPGPAAG